MSPEGFVTADRRARLIIARPRRPPYDSTFSHALDARLNAIVESRKPRTMSSRDLFGEAVLPPIGVEFAGGHRIAVQTESIVRRESILNSVGSLALILPLLFLVFRSFWLVAVGSSAAGDAGGAIGAAFTVWHKLGGKRSFRMDHAYWGPAFGAADIAQVIAGHRSELSATGCSLEEISDEALLCRRTAAAIADGKVVGWFQGRMEWGPRALGNRSILCDPRRADMKALLNAKIKRRELFRPFAPSVLENFVGEWFEEDDAVPFMMQVFQIREDKRKLIPAVTHVDGSGRLQTVSAETNPRYHRVIENFRTLTGVPMVLNTSFNENEPVVCRPEEALDCFLRTKMDLLVIGDIVISRSQRFE